MGPLLPFLVSCKVPCVSVVVVVVVVLDFNFGVFCLFLFYAMDVPTNFWLFCFQISLFFECCFFFFLSLSTLVQFFWCFVHSCDDALIILVIVFFWIIIYMGVLLFFSSLHDALVQKFWYVCVCVCVFPSLCVMCLLQILVFLCANALFQQFFCCCCFDFLGFGVGGGGGCCFSLSFSLSCKMTLSSCCSKILVVVVVHS